MILVDDILLSPFRGFLWIFKEMFNAVEQEIAGESDAITHQLSELYMMLETGKISEDEFDAEEKILLDRLDEIQAQDMEDEDV